jgi:hypothetical protein
LAQKVAHPFDGPLAVFGSEAAAHEIAQRAAHALFFEEVIRQMFEEIFGGGKENLLSAIPVCVAMDSHMR